MTDSRTRLDQRIAGLGPDIVAVEPFDHGVFLRRLREDDPTRPFGDALLDQRIVAGLGTIWRSEACFAAAIDPWRPTGDVSDAEAVAPLDAVRPLMQRSALEGFTKRLVQVHGRTGRPCPRCGERIVQRGQGDDNRRLCWCPGCQR